MGLQGAHLQEGRGSGARWGRGQGGAEHPGDDGAEKVWPGWPTGEHHQMEEGMGRWGFSSQFP